MKNKMFFKVIYIFTTICSIGLLVSFSFLSSRFSNIQNKAYVQSYLNQCKNSDNNLIYSNIKIESNEYVNDTINLFKAGYSSNLSNKSNKLLAISSNKTIVESFSTYFCDDELAFTSSLVSGYAYTNNLDSVTFETININLYKPREKEEEIRYDTSRYDGFVYIPDYYADNIIEKFDNINSYDELIDNSKLFSFGIRVNHRIYKYKIANIFHVNNFKNEYSSVKHKYTDQLNGKKIDSFLNGYCFISNYETIIKEYSYLDLTLLNIMENKEILFNQYVNSIRQVTNSNNNIKIIPYFGFVKNGLIQYFGGSENIFYNISSSSFEFDYLFWLVIFFAMCIVAIAVFSFFSNKLSKNLKKLFLMFVCINILYLLVAFILKKTVLSIQMFLMFNTYSLGLSACLILFSFLLMLSRSIVGENHDK